MAKVTLSQKARRDLHMIHDYIQDQLLTPPFRTIKQPIKTG